MTEPAVLPAALALHLSAPPGSKDRLGKGAAEVLVTAALIAAANSDWDKDTIRSFQQEQDLHPKVWDKLVSIHRDQRLVPIKDLLPASYTALYALVVMSDEELTEALQQGLVSTKASSRALLDWTKAYRLKSTGIEQEIAVTLVLRDELTPEQQQDLMDALQETAGRFGAEIREGKGGVKQAEIKAEGRKALAEDIDAQLMRLLGPVVQSAPDDLKEKFEISSAGDLIAARRQVFTGFLQLLEKKEQGVFWRKYSRVYCLKIAYDFNLTESRAERHQLRKRLDEAVQRWGNEIDGLKGIIAEVQSTYMA